MRIILLLSITLLYSEVKEHVKDSIKIPAFDLSKPMNIPGLVPTNISALNMKTNLLPYQIDAIKDNANQFIPEPVSDNDIVILETSRGTMKLKLFPKIAPKHCTNFKKLANSGFYDGTKFHRIIPGFMIQGGDINSRDNDGDNDGFGGPGWTVDAEFSDRPHLRGTLSMARSADPNSAGSQFFICVDQAYHLDLKYTAFGNVIDGDEILDIITRIPSEAKQVFKSFKTKIPEHKSEENWMEYPFNGKTFYVKIPRTTTADIYKDVIKKQLKNKHRPFIPVIIQSIRAVDSNNSLNE